MKVNQLTKIDKNGPQYIPALLMMNGIRQDKIAVEKGVSRAFVSMVARRKRGGTKKYGLKLELVRQAIADKLDMPVEELFSNNAT